MKHINIGSLSSNAQIWDPKNVYVNKILQEKWSCIIKHSKKGKVFPLQARCGPEGG